MSPFLIFVCFFFLVGLFVLSWLVETWGRVFKSFFQCFSLLLLLFFKLDFLFVLFAMIGEGVGSCVQVSPCL